MLWFLARWFTIAPIHSMIVRGAIASVRRDYAGRSPAIVGTLFYGATYLDPRHLVVWYLVQSDSGLRDAMASGQDVELAEATKAALIRRHYSRAAMAGVHVGMASRESIEAAGGWRQYFA